MKQEPLRKCFRWHDSTLTPVQVGVVQEYPLQLIVNGKEIATLIASPHDLRFLVAGFLRLQGFVNTLDDFELFSVCDDFGIANVRIKRELPERLKPVLTSGCGTGITFSLPGITGDTRIYGTPAQASSFKSEELFQLMSELSARADQYKSHGGIHSAAVGSHGQLLLYAEDLGRHNTLDRIAGEALFKGIDLSTAMLVTSGRVSSEMVAKATLLGIRFIASRTSPTNMAAQLCEEQGICLAGYVRGERFTLYAHPEMLSQYPETEKISGVTGAILAGGSSRRMGVNKSLLQFGDVPLIEILYRVLASLFNEVLIVTNTPEDYAFIPCRKVPDIYPAAGSVAGLHSALSHSSNSKVFVAACDMPFVDSKLVRILCNLATDDLDAVIPFSAGGQEPLHAVYSIGCREKLDLAITSGERKILDIIKQFRAQLVTWEELRNFNGAERSFINVNTPEDFEKLKTLLQ